VTAALEAGRAASARRAWREARDALARADAAAPLAADDLELLACAAYMVGAEEEYLRGLERAHAAHLDAGRPRRAVRCAFWIGMTMALGGAMGGASGWFGRAQRSLEAEPADCAERGYLLVPLAFRQAMAGEPEAALAVSVDAVAIAERFGDRELLALAIFQRGRLLVSMGRISEGIALLDEAMVAATAGELSPVLTGTIYCGVILACQEAHEARRAREWTAALASWCDEQPEMVAFTGRCLLHRAQVMQLCGDWDDALDEAARATARAGMAASGSAEALYLQGEIRRLRGDLAQAEHAYREASRLGREPQPGLALLRLAQGRGAAAAAAMRRAAGEVTEPSMRARVLPACVEVMVAVGRPDEARAAALELERLAAAFRSELLDAAVAQARGTVALAEGAAGEALGELRRARELWRALEAPYETARAGALIGRACRALGDEDTAAFELDAAAAAFRALGAATDLASLDAGRDPARASHGLSRRELEVLRLLAAGATNKAIAADLVLSVRTVDRHVSNIFTKLGVPTRAAATAFAHEHRLV
jgi:ATP/maltotriose-dependent transcriptional regulator MalT